MLVMDEAHQTIVQILDGFCENHIDLFPAVDLLKTCYGQVLTGSQTGFFRILEERLQSEPISFPSSSNVKRSAHVLIIRAWAAFGLADALPKLLFSLLRPDSREAMESWAFMIGQELFISLGSHKSRFSDAALIRIKAECATIAYDQSVGLTGSRFPRALVEVSQQLEKLVKQIEFDRNVVQKLRPQPNAAGPAVPQQDATRKVATSTASSELWKRFDHSLFALKLHEPSRKMHEETESRRRKVQFDRLEIGQGKGVGLLVALVDSDLSVLREFLEKDIDRICREVWRAQGNSVTAEFVRVVILGTVFNTIDVRIGSIKWGMEATAERQCLSKDLSPARTRLVQAVDQLKSSLSNRYEIEARELEWKTVGAPEEKKETKEAPKEGSKSTSLVTTVSMCIGHNIDKLRKECGWSYDVLAGKTGIDKKAILSHVHGKSKPNPRTKKEYAQAFAKELNRPITANDLEE
jgi:DNA-binding XRE family transcriptional regulator